MRTMLIGALLAMSSALLGCGDDAPEETEEQARMLEQLRETCPMQLAGAGVEYEETDDAVVLTFTAEPDDVPEMQRRVRAMADMYERAHRGEMQWRDMAEHHRAMHGEQAMPHGPMPPVHARAETGEGGARLVLTPADGADLEEIREHAFAHHQRYREGQCWLAPS